MLAFTAQSNEYMPCCWPTTQYSGKLCAISRVSLHVAEAKQNFPGGAGADEALLQDFCFCEHWLSVCRMCESALTAFIAQKDEQETVEGKGAGDPENALHLPLNTDLVSDTISRATGQRYAFLELSVVCVLSIFFCVEKLSGFISCKPKYG